MSDIRVERTKSYLQGALIELLREKPLEKVTVKEVLDRAQVSKKAFYSHYADIIDLAIDAFLWPHARYGKDSRPMREGASMQEICDNVLHDLVVHLLFIKENPNLSRAVLLNMGRDPYFDRAEIDGGIVFLTGFAHDSEGPGRAPFLTQEACACYIFNGANSPVRNWLRRGMVEDVELVSKQCLLLNLQCARLMDGKAVSAETVTYINGWRYEQSSQTHRTL